MKKKLIAVSIFTALLSACGSSSDNAETPITPVLPPPISSPTPPPAAVPATFPISIIGRITDSPIANAKVVLSVGNETFETLGDDDGNYRFNIKLDSMADSVMRIDAFGVDDQSFVHFRSYLGHTKTLLVDGAELSSNDIFALNVTNVTTAEAGLLEVYNGGQITSVADYQYASERFDSTSVMSYATAIKAAVDGLNAIPVDLPDGIRSTYELALSADAIKHVANRAKRIDAEAYQALSSEIAEDEDLTKGVLNDMPTRFHFYNSNDFYSLGMFDLTDDGTATFIGGEGSGKGQWVTQGNGVSITFDEFEARNTYATVAGKNVKTFNSVNNFNLYFLGDNSVRGPGYIEYDSYYVVDGEVDAEFNHDGGGTILVESLAKPINIDPGEYVINVPRSWLEGEITTHPFFTRTLLTDIAYLRVFENNAYELTQVVDVDSNQEYESVITAGTIVLEDGKLIFHGRSGKLEVVKLTNFSTDEQVQYVSAYGKTGHVSGFNDGNAGTGYEASVVDGLQGGLMIKLGEEDFTSAFSGWFAQDVVKSEQNTLWYHFTETKLFTYYWRDFNRDTAITNNELIRSTYAINNKNGVVTGRRFEAISRQEGVCADTPFVGGSSGCELTEEISFSALADLDDNTINNSAVLLTNENHGLYQSFPAGSTPFLSVATTRIIPLYKKDEGPHFIKSL